MPDSFRLRVMKGLCDALKEITPGNGYQHDLSNFSDSAGRDTERVVRGRAQFGENDPIPIIAIIEDPATELPVNGPTTSSKAQNTFRVLIQGFVKDDPDHRLDPAYALSAEVIVALVRAKQAKEGILGLDQPLRAPCVMAMSIGQPVHRSGDDEVSDPAYFMIRVSLLLAEDLEQPFA